MISLLIGLPFGTWIALGNFRGRSVLLSIVNTGMALPPVVVGLVVAMTLWRSGPLGDLKLIYTHCRHHHCTDDHFRACSHGTHRSGARSIRPSPAATIAWVGSIPSTNDLDAVA